MSDKGPVSRLYKELSKLDSKKTPNDLIGRLAEDMKKHFTKESTRTGIDP